LNLKSSCRFVKTKEDPSSFFLNAFIFTTKISYSQVSTDKLNIIFYYKNPIYLGLFKNGLRSSNSLRAPASVWAGIKGKSVSWLSAFSLILISRHYDSHTDYTNFVKRYIFGGSGWASCLWDICRQTQRVAGENTISILISQANFILRFVQLSVFVGYCFEFFKVAK